jgi:hypothetical protein
LIVRHIAQPAELDLGFPADVAVSCSEAQSPRLEANHPNNTLVLERDVAHNFADEPMAEPVVLIQHFVEAGDLITMDWPYNKTFKVPEVLYFHLLTSTTSWLSAPIALHYPSSVSLIEDFDFALGV